MVHRIVLSLELEIPTWSARVMIMEYIGNKKEEIGRVIGDHPFTLLSESFFAVKPGAWATIEDCRAGGGEELMDPCTHHCGGKPLTFII